MAVAHGGFAPVRAGDDARLAKSRQGGDCARPHVRGAWRVAGLSGVLVGGGMKLGTADERGSAQINAPQKNQSGFNRLSRVDYGLHSRSFLGYLRSSAVQFRVWKNEREDWLSDMDSNHDKGLQRALCYHYTIGHTAEQTNQHPAVCK